MPVALQHGLNLLSLDGGGVRGLSSLLILEKLMQNINEENPPKPCDYFDMIGGTSTGGIIAIMLGRLQMDVSTCIQAYTEMMERVFAEKHAHGFDSNKKMQARFDTEALENGIKALLGNKDAPFREEFPRCKVFVCATSAHNRRSVLFSNYARDKGTIKDAKIWEAARATSAEPTFFERIEIGRFKQAYLSGSTGANNPVNQLWSEAEQQWGQPLAGKINCLVSIGAGEPTSKGFGNSLAEVWNTLKDISRDAESSARNFLDNHLDLTEGPMRYFRFNVTAGLGDVGLEEYKDIPLIASATDDYFEDREVHMKVQQLHTHLSSTDRNIIRILVDRHSSTARDESMRRSDSPLPQWIAEQHGGSDRVHRGRRSASPRIQSAADPVMLETGISSMSLHQSMSDSQYPWVVSKSNPDLAPVRPSAVQSEGEPVAAYEHRPPWSSMIRKDESQAAEEELRSTPAEFSVLSLTRTSSSNGSTESRSSLHEEDSAPKVTMIAGALLSHTPEGPENVSTTSLALSSVAIKAQLQKSLSTYTEVRVYTTKPPAPTSVVNRAREERAQGVLLSSQFNISRFFSGEESSVRLVEDDMTLRKGGLSTDFLRYAIINALEDQPAVHVISYCCSAKLDGIRASSILKDMMRSLTLQLLEIADLEGFVPPDDFDADQADSLYNIFRDVASRSRHVPCFCLIDRWVALEDEVGEDEVARALETLFRQVESFNRGVGKSFNLLFTDVRRCKSVRNKLSSEADAFNVCGNVGRGFRRLPGPSFQTKLRELRGCYS